MNATQIAQELENRNEEWVGILTGLISVPSENPPGDTRNIAGYLCSILDERGIEYSIVDPKSEMPNVIAHVDGQASDASEGPNLTFNGHLDTFPKRNLDLWDRDPFSGEIDDGKIHGRGACDMHGGFTASLAALIYLSEHRDKFQGNVSLVAVSDEETGGQWGTEYLVENYPEYNGDVVLSGEPSANRVVRFGERGIAWVRITVTGIGAHTCSVPRGLSAIEILLDVLADVQQLPKIDGLVGVPDEVEEIIVAGREDFDAAYGDGATDMALELQTNVGTIEGGDQVNLVAEKATAQVDIRLPIGTTTDEALREITNIASTHEGTVEIQCFSSRDPTWSDITHPMFNYIKEYSKQVRGSEPSLSCGLAFTDCAFYRMEGIPCVVYGPNPHNLGAPNEYIYVDDFMEIVKTHVLASSRYMGVIT